MSTLPIPRRTSCSIALCVLALTTPARAVPEETAASSDPTLSAEVAAVVDRLRCVDDPAQCQRAWEAWERYCLTLDSQLQDAERRAASCEMLSAAAATDCPLEIRLLLLRMVERIGKEEAAPGLGMLLTDADVLVADAARRALMNQGTRGARVVLLAALQSADSPERQAALIEAVAFARDADDCEAFASWLEAEDPAVARAALRAVVASEAPSVFPILLGRLSNASAERADSLAAAIVEAARSAAAPPQDAVQALRTVRSDPRLPPEVRAAALLELARKAPSEVVEELGAALVSGVRRDQEAGLAALRELPAELAATLLARHAELSGEVLARTCAVAGERRLAVCGEVLGEIAREASDSEARLAAIRALGHVEATAEVGWLIEQLSRNESDVVAAAEDALAAYRSGAPDELLLGRLRQDQSNTVQTLDLLSRRRAVSAVDWALERMAAEDQALRFAARNCVARLASADHIPRLLAQAELAPQEDRDEFIRAIVTICERLPAGGSRVDMLLECAAQQRSALGQEITLGALGRLGGPQARELLLARLSAQEPAVRTAALTALTNWPDASVTDQLLWHAQQSGNADHRRRALRGVARVAVLRGGDKTPAERLAVLRIAMSLAEREDDRRLVLERAQAVELWETVQFVRPYLNDAALCDTVCRTIVQVARLPALRAEHPEILFDLEQVVERCGDVQVVTRAKRWLQESRDKQDGE